MMTDLDFYELSFDSVKFYIGLTIQGYKNDAANGLDTLSFHAGLACGARASFQHLALSICNKSADLHCDRIFSDATALESIIHSSFYGDLHE